MSHPLERLRHHVTGAIERGEAVPVVERPAVPAYTREGRTVLHGGRPLFTLHRIDGTPPVVADALTDWIVRKPNMQGVDLAELEADWMAKP